MKLYLVGSTWYAYHVADNKRWRFSRVRAHWVDPVNLPFKGV